MRRVLVLFLLIASDSLAQNSEWWRDTFVYQIYPRSFKDSNGDGIGDLNGITSKLDHLADLGVSALWLSPIYTSPMVDFGYDIANFTNIDSIFGTLADFSKLVTKAKSLKLKVVLDFVPNHSSDKHAWFPKSVQKVKPYDEYYVWRDAKMVNGTRQPPNNWLSAFQGSAWEWNNVRKQYYLHQFAAGQPDLNYNSSALQEEMKNVLRFWLKLGIDGIRIDTIPNLIEDSRFLDEPKIPNTGLPETDPGTLQHIYTADQDQTYDILKSWRDVLDSSNGTKKIILTEAWTSLPLTMKYYTYGSNVPFNFMFINQLGNYSTPLDFKRIIDRYLNSIPSGQQANWVVGNHDSHRAGSRYGEQRANQIPMLAAVLPGVGVLYNGDEIGMIDRQLTWAETVDPAGCNAGPGRYNVTSRDPERTPFQWDATMNAGFTSGNKTWLPVHPNYKTLNLAAQKGVSTSHYGVTKQLVLLKKDQIIRTGSTQLVVIGNEALGVVRRLDFSRTVVLLINFTEKQLKVDASSWLNIPEVMSVYVASVGSKITPGSRVNTAALNLPAAASIILK